MKLNMDITISKSAYQLLAHLESIKCRLFLDGDKLKIDAPKGAISEELKVKIKKHREELISHLSKRATNQFSIPLAKECPSYPISYAQRRLWILSQFKGGSEVYNIPSIIPIHQNLDVAILRNSVMHMVARHEILRTVFRKTTTDEIHQFIIPSEILSFKIDFKDFSKAKLVDAEKSALSFYEKNAFIPFKLDEGPLFRFCLIKVAEEKSYLYFNIHHIISDGWSMEIFTRELMQIYTGLSQRVEVVLPPLRIQYKDYTIWQLEQMKNGEHEVDKIYWQSQLSVPIPLLELPTLKKRPKIKTSTGTSLKIYIDQLQTKELLSFVKEQEGSLFSVLFAAWNVLFYKYTNLKDIVIGTPVSGRVHPDLENQIGFYINTLPLRTKVLPEESFLSFNKRVHTDSYAAFDHQMYPFDCMVEDMNLIVDTSRSSVFDVLFTLQNITSNTVEISEEEICQVNVKPAKSKFDIEIVIDPNDELIGIELIYNTDVYEQSLIEQFLLSYKHLLSTLVKSPEKPMTELSFITKKEIALLKGFNNTKEKYPHNKTVLDLFKEQVAQTPKARAVVFDNAELSFIELDETSSRLANYLRNKYKVKAKDYIGVQLDRSEWMLVSILAILKTGAAYLPMATDYPEQRVEYIQKDSNYIVAINTQEIERFTAVEMDFDSEIDVIVDPSFPAYVIYTSGSTGKPKGVVNHHAGIYNRLLWKKKYLKVVTSDIILQKTPFTFDVSVWELLLPVISGCTLVFAKPEGHKDPIYLQKLIALNKVSIVHFVPSMLNVFLQNLEEDLSSLMHVVCSGEALPEDMVHAFKNKIPDAHIHNLYGPTEAAVDVTAIDLTNESLDEYGVSIGKPVANTKIYIVDENMKLQPVGVPGELLIGGIQVSYGYLNRPELNAKCFVHNPFVKGELVYKTGDEAMWLNDGNLKYIGRKDHQVKIRGQRIELGEIEYHLKQKESLKEIVVLVQEKQEEKELVAFLVSDQKENASELQMYLSNTLPGYMVPSKYYQLETMPLTSNGKVDRKTLLQHEESQLATGAAYVGPRSIKDSKMIAIWEDVLQQEKIGLLDNYFALGGDSIKAISVIIKINKKLETNIGVSDLYLHQTIKDLVDFIAENEFQYSETRSSYGYDQIQQIRTQIEKENKAKNTLPLNYESIYPLVPIEEGMIFSSLLRTEEPIYYDRFVYTAIIEDISSLKSAMQTLVKRHSILRTLYYMEDFSRPVKVVLDTAEIPMEFIDCRKLTKKEQSAKLDQIRREDLEKRLTFNGELLYNFKFVQLNELEYYIVWNFHHAILDGWSVAVFTQELTLLLSKDKATTLPELPFSYKDYCARVLGMNSSKETMAYWQNLLKDYSRNKLPFNFKGVKISDELGMNVAEAYVDETTLEQLVGLSEHLQVSFKAICLAAHSFLMSVICAEEDVVTGVVSHDRPELEQSERILGCFLNTIPIRVNFKGINEVTSLIKLVNDYLIYSKQHETHISHVARSIGEKTTIENPIFDTLFNYMHFHVLEEVENNATISSTPIELDNTLITSDEMTNTLFDFEVSRKTNGLKLRVKYTPSFFTEEDAKEALKMYQRILKAFLNEAPLNIEMIMDDKDYNELIYTYNDTIVEENKEVTIHELFEEQCQKTPTNIALRQDGKTLTYEILNKRSNEIANHLLEMGITSGTNIGVLCTRSFDMIIALYGVLKAGGSYVPIDPDYPLQRQEYIVENSNVSIILTNNKGALEKKLFEKEFIQISEIETNKKENNPRIPIKGDQLAYTIYTSGSTGNPKGVMIEHYAAVNLIRWVNETFSVNETDRLLFITSVCFDLSVYDIFGILASGGSLVIARKEEVQDFNTLKKLLVAERITFWDSVPTTFNYLVGELEEDQVIDDFPDLRLVFMSGDWIPVQLPDRAKKFFLNAEIISLGGATEGTVWSNYYPITKVQPNWTSIPYGKPIRNNFFYVLDDQLRPAPKGMVGELYIGGIGVARGYDNDSIKTNAAFLEDPFNTSMGGRMYRTGDLGRWLRNGNMEFIGRKDNQVKIRGYRVELGEIESVLLKHDSVKEAIVQAITDGNNQKQLCAYLVVRNTYANEVLRQCIQDILPEYMLPTYYVLLDALPLNSNGKIDRKALPEPDQTVNNDKVFIAPTTQMQKTIADIWCGILRIDSLSINDDFFELGANSLSVASFVARFHKKMEYSIEVRDVFFNPTVAQLANMLQDAKKESFITIEKAEEAESYPLSDAQRRLWVLSQFKEASIAYNLPEKIKLTNKINITAFKTAIEQVIERHEILRTVFKEDKNGEVRQWILPFEEGSFHIDFKDVRNTKNAHNEIQSFIENDSVAPFKLDEWPLIRTSLFQINDDEYLFYYNMHHIISDGWSMQVLANDVLHFYQNSEIQNTLLPDLNFQYKDYAVQQSKQLKGDRFNIDKAYWLEKISGNLPLLNLPTTKKRPIVKTYRGNTLTTFLSKEITKELNEFVTKRGGTLFMGLLTSLKILLYRYTGQEDIIIGSPVAGRDHEDLEAQIGFYINTLVLRNRVHPEDNFEALFDKIKHSTLEAFSHQSYPFDALVEEVKVKRDTARAAIFDVMLVLQNANSADSTLQLSEQELLAIKDIGYSTSKFDLLFNISETDGYLSFSVEYNTDVYERELIERFIGHYKKLLTVVLEKPNESIETVDFLPLEERRLYVSNFNATNIKYPSNKTVLDFINEQVNNNGSKVALTLGKEHLSFKELDEKSNQLSHYLISLGVVKEDLIPIISDRSFEMFIGILGIMKAGAAYVPIAPLNPKERTLFILREIEAKVVLCNDTIPEFHLESDLFRIDLEGSSFANFSKSASKVSVLPRDAAYVIYTSGTTGKPKGVINEHSGLLNRLLWMKDELQLSEESVLLQKTPYVFDVSIWEIILPLMTGSRLVITKPGEHKDPNYLQDIIQEEAVSTIHFVPSMLNIFLEVLSEKLNSLEKVICSGEALSSSVVNTFKKKLPNVNIYNYYGPTEAAIDVTAINLTEVNTSQDISIGYPVANTHIYIVNKSLQLQPVGVVGELLIGGVQVARGYLKREVLTEQKFISSPFIEGERLYKTGDLACWLPDGSISYKGRLDHQVKIRGYRIELEEIESHLLSFPMVNNAKVLVKNEGDKSELVAYLIGNDIDTILLQSHLKSKLPEYMVPQFFKILDSMPLTENGKLDSQKLLELETKVLKTNQFVAPHTKLEKHLAAIWIEVLEIEKVGVTDNFFELGGHSINAVKILLEIQKRLGVKFDIAKLFNNPTILGLANIIASENPHYSKTDRTDEEVVDQISI